MPTTCLPVVDAGVLVLCPAPAGRLRLRSEPAWMWLDARLYPSPRWGRDPGNHGAHALSVIPVDSTKLLKLIHLKSFKKNASLKGHSTDFDMNLY